LDVIIVDIHVEIGNVQKCCVRSACYNFVMVFILFSKIGLWLAARLKILYVALGLKSLPTTELESQSVFLVNVFLLNYANTRSAK